MTARGRTALRQRAPHVSYREPGSDEEDAPFASDDGDYADPAIDSSSRRASRSLRSQTRRSLRRPASPSPPHETPPPKRLKPTPRVKSLARTSHDSATQAKRQSRKRNPAFAPRPINSARALTATKVPTIAVPSDSKVPAWHLLPEEILKSILEYASHPMRSAELDSLPGRGWLARCATVCKAFTSSALKVLYRDPPLVDLGDPHELLDLLRKHTLLADYGSMVKCLHLDAAKTLSYSVAMYGLMNVSALVANTPQLAELDITNPIDRPPYRPIGRGRPWLYPADLFTTLENVGIKLKAWRWHAHMMKHVAAALPDEEATIISHHHGSVFQDLRHIALSHFELSQTNKKRPSQPATDAVDVQTSPSLEGTLGRVLAPLTKLRSLELISCQSEDWAAVLDGLPSSLEHLSISNSTFIHADALRSFLLAKGSHLRTLVLDHNQALSLQFLADLKSSCPRLEYLHMDLTYYSPVAQYKDSDPLFDLLLNVDEPPTWPSSLESIELHHLRQWDQEAAEVFFMSLLDSAEQLPYLRTLVIKAILNINWRERAGFRAKWIGRLHRVFGDRSPLPNPALASFKAFRMSKGIIDKSEEADDVIMMGSSAAPKPKPDAEESSPTKNARRSRRIKENEETQEAAARVAAELAAADPGTPGTTTSDGQDEWHPGHIHGRCNIVDINIDNLRPGEVLFNEGDFLDDEVSGDEDWNGDNDRDEGTAYAW